MKLPWATRQASPEASVSGATAAGSRKRSFDPTGRACGSYARQLETRGAGGRGGRGVPFPATRVH